MIIYVSFEKKRIYDFVTRDMSRIMTCVESCRWYCYDLRLRKDVTTFSYDEHSKS